MFDLLAKLLSSIATFVFPVFASYKALRTNDPAQLVPWLMYWVVVACVLVVESWVGWVLVWIPFYQEIRAGFMLWLVLPQTQGATKLYLEYVHPWLTKHEHDIEDFMARAHDHAKTLGIQYIRRLINIAKQAVFGSLQEAQTAAAQPPPPPPPKDAASYAQALFSRWRVPALTPYAPQMATDFYNFLSTALQQGQQPGAHGGSGLIPPTITGQAERARFIELQKQRLNTVMAALEREMDNISNSPDDTPGVLSKSPSQGNISSHDGDFDHVSMVDVASAAAASQKGSAGLWMPWGWGSGAPKTTEEKKDA